MFGVGELYKRFVIYVAHEIVEGGPLGRRGRRGEAMQHRKTISRVLGQPVLDGFV
jgi:hypothetical protein